MKKNQKIKAWIKLSRILLHSAKQNKLAFYAMLIAKLYLLKQYFVFNASFQSILCAIFSYAGPLSFRIMLNSKYVIRGDSKHVIAGLTRNLLPTAPYQNREFSSPFQGEVPGGRRGFC
jgi:hypothetical protein